MPNQTGNLVLLKTCFDMTEAQILRGILETNEILCFLLDEHHNNVAFHLNFALGGVRIMVLADDLEKAQNLINEQIEDNIPAEEKIEFVKRPFFANLILVIFGFFSGVPLFYPKKAKK